jgi:hypothetical protein
MRPGIAAYFARRGASPDKVAHAIADAIMRNTAVVPVGADAWFIYVGKRLAPHLSAWVAAQGRKRARAL